MAAIYVVHAPADRAFVTSTLLPPLPSLGFDSWVAARRGDETALAACRAAIVVVSDAARRSPAVRAHAARALAATTMVLPVRHDGTKPRDVLPGLGLLPAIDLASLPRAGADDRVTRLRARLPELLPDPAAAAGGEGAPGARPIPWSEESFSDYLQEAIARHDFSRGNTLLDALAAHLIRRGAPYPASYARLDLGRLRARRQFPLMERYAGLVRAAGTKDWQVERQRAQALIERGHFEEARGVLDAIVDGAPRRDEESFEARGLVGRLLKQRYVDAPAAAGAGELLRQAYDEYAGVHRRAPGRIWHGINAVSVALRAHRDGLPWGDPAAARRRATAIVRRLAGQKALDVWDYATRVEALVALDRLDEAARALHDYLAHPDMDAFEVSSTFRQFDEVLRLGEHPDARARKLHADLLRAADRYRAGGTAREPAPAGDAPDTPRQSILIRVSDPHWAPRSQDGLTLGPRVGTVISARATAAAIQRLLKDPVAIAIEESRPATDTDEATAAAAAADGWTYVQRRDRYSDSGGEFAEDGSGALVGVIDTGIDVLHRAFLGGDGRTRIVAVWDQRDRTNSAPRPAGVDYGRVYGAAEIDGFVADPSTLPRTLGRNPGPMRADGTRRPGHGTHVASIAAGRPTAAFPGGIAPGAGLIVVIVKPEDVEIGYSRAHIDALAFIGATARADGRPVVVNVSRGMNGGAHDGQSALEVAFNEFSNGGRQPGRVVVKSSGNQCGSGWHASFTASVATELRWRRPPADAGVLDPTEHLELWWSSANALRFQLIAPSGEKTPWITDGEPEVTGELLPGGDYALQLVKRHVDNGDSVLRVDIGGRLSGVAEGGWALAVEPVAIHADPTLHAWISAGLGTPSRFETFADDGLTLTVPGTAHSVITVGAMAVGNPSVAPVFSSRGPTRDGRQKPDVAAPGVGVVAALSGTLDDVGPEDGTSMAAPHVTGAIALVLSRAARAGRQVPSATQVRAALIQKARREGTRLEFDPWCGFGVLDVAALLAAF